jgi:hypothetical protein
MFSSLTDQLRNEIARIVSILTTHERLRIVLFERAKAAESADKTVGQETNPQVESPLDPRCIEELLTLLARDMPRKLDWQIYDHCAAFTRLYAAYEQFVNDLVSNYVDLLPRLYILYDDLPEAVSVNHRIGLGQMLIKIGARKQYRDIDEAAIIRALSGGIAGSSSYSLVPEAFVAERQNYKFNILVEMFSHLGFDNCGQQILRHPATTNFMRLTRGEADTVQGELDKFVDYRNEAAHRVVDNIVAIDEIRKIGQFLGVLGDALAEMVELAVIKRHLELGKSVTVGTVKEVHHRGFVVVASMSKSRLNVGESIIIHNDKTKQCAKTEVVSIHMDDVEQVGVDAEDGQELGIRLTKRAKLGWELRRLSPLGEKPVEMQLTIDEAMGPMTDELVVEAEPSDFLEGSDSEAKAQDPTEGP